MNRLKTAAMALLAFAILFTGELVPAAVTPPTEDPEVAQTKDLLNRVETSVDSISSVLKSFINATDDEREMIRFKARKDVETLNSVQPEIVDRILEHEENGKPIDSLVQQFSRVIKKEIYIYQKIAKWYFNRIDTLRDKRATATQVEASKLELNIREARQRLNTLLGTQVKILEAADSLQLDTRRAWSTIEKLLLGRGDHLVGRLQLADKDRDQLTREKKDLEKALAPNSQISAKLLQIQAAERRIKGIAESLKDTANHLALRGYDTSDYRRIVIAATGEVTEDIFDTKVFFGLVRTYTRQGLDWSFRYAPRLAVQILALLGTILLFRLSFRFFWSALDRIGVIRMPRLMRDLISRLLRPIATTLGLFFGLWFLGANPATLLAGVGIAGLVIGLALQDTLSNLAAGFFILITQPYDVDHVVEVGGVLGTVKAMGLSNTTVVTFDGRRLLIPNRKIWGEVIENRSAEPQRRLDIAVKVGFQENIEQVTRELEELLLGTDNVLHEPRPYAFVAEIADSWIEITVRSWVKNSYWYGMSLALPGVIHKHFVDAGIEIPYPKREIISPMPAETKPIAKKTPSRKQLDQSI